MTNGSTTPYDHLLRDVSKHREQWQWYGRFYGILYPATRISLIVATSIVAAEDTLDGTPLQPLVQWVAVLALLVAIVTSLDTWMKPAVRWQASVKARDDFEQLQEAIEEATDKADTAALAAFSKRRAEIYADARANYVF